MSPTEKYFLMVFGAILAVVGILLFAKKGPDVFRPPFVLIDQR